MATPYEKDFYDWTQEQAQLLRSGQLSSADVEHIAEEIESMGKNDYRALRSMLHNILTHLLKLQYSPAVDPREGWIEEVSEFRNQVDLILEDSPSLKLKLNDAFGREWPIARKTALRSMNTYRESIEIPETCAYTLAEITDRDFFPIWGD